MGYTRKALATRGRILDAAAELIFSKGFNATKLLEVLTASNVQKGNFYYYFASKEDLGLAVIHERGGEMIAGWMEKAIDPKANPWVNIKALASAIAGSSSPSKAGRTPVAILALERSELSADFCQAIGEMLDVVVAGIANEFARLREMGKLATDMDPQLLARLVFGIVEGALLSYRSIRNYSAFESLVGLGLECIKARALK